MKPYENLKFDNPEIFTKKYSFLVKKYEILGTNIFLERKINSDLEQIYLCTLSRSSRAELVGLLKKLIEDTDKKSKFHPIRDQAREILRLLNENSSIKTIDDLLFELSNFDKSNQSTTINETSVFISPVNNHKDSQISNDLDILEKYLYFEDNQNNSDLSKVDRKVMYYLKSLRDYYNKGNFHNFKIRVKEIYEYLLRGNETFIDVSKVYKLYNFIEKERVNNFTLLAEIIGQENQSLFTVKDAVQYKSETLQEYEFNDKNILKNIHSFFTVPYFLKNADTSIKKEINESLRIIYEKYTKKDFISFYTEIKKLKILLEPIEKLNKFLTNVDIILYTIQSKEIRSIDYLTSICNSKKYVYPQAKQESNETKISISQEGKEVLEKEEKIVQNDYISKNTIIDLLDSLKNEYEIQFNNFSEDIIRERERKALLIGLSGMALINYGKVGGAQLSLKMEEIKDYEFLISLRADILKEEPLEKIENKLKMKIN